MKKSGLLSFLLLNLLILTNCYSNSSSKAQSEKSTVVAGTEYVKPEKQFINPLLVDTTLSPTYYLRFGDQDLLGVTGNVGEMTIYDSEAGGAPLHMNGKELFLHSVVHYNANGLPVLIEKAGKKRMEFFYNNTGLPEKVTRYYTDAESNYTSSVSSYTYDTFGNLNSTYRYNVLKDRSYDFTDYTEYRYRENNGTVAVTYMGVATDALGQALYMKEIQFKNNLPVLLESNSNQLLFNDRSQWYKEHYTYDDHHLLKELCEDYRTGTRCKIYLRDDKGRVIKKTDSLYDNKTKSSTLLTDIYNYSGNSVVQTYTVNTTTYHSLYGPNGVQYKKNCRYDDAGRLIMKQTIESGNNITLQYSYKTDDKNNWTWRSKNEKYGTGPADENNTITSFTFRKITYGTGIANNLQSKAPADAGAERLKKEVLKKNRFLHNINEE